MLYLGKSRGSWRRGDYGDVAGRWPLDWYYRCNIVNNIPLSWCAWGRHKSRYLVGWPLRRVDQRVLSSTEPFLRTLYKRYRCLLLNIHSLVARVHGGLFAAVLRTENTERPHIIRSYAGSRLTILLPQSLALFYIAKLSPCTYNAYIHESLKLFITDDLTFCNESTM